jgi:hypothetical protein
VLENNSPALKQHLQVKYIQAIMLKTAFSSIFFLADYKRIFCVISQKDLLFITG